MKRIRHPFATCKRRSGEKPVQNNLALTPSDILRMAEQGIPASSANNPNLIDGNSDNDWNVPLEERRGIDMTDLWNERQNIKSKFRKAHDTAPIEPVKTE